MSELRHDPLTDRWVIISPERGVRPLDTLRTPDKSKTGFCPFCPGNEDKTPLPELYAVFKNGEIRREIDNREAIRSDWLVRVIPNKYPALQPIGGLKRKGIGVFDRMNGIGAHEICIESPEHEIDISMLPIDHIVLVLNSLKYRMIDLERDPRFRYLSLFKNKGGDAGASLEHSHWQLNALPITPSEIARELYCSKIHFNEKERCLICDILSQELESGERIVESNEAFVVMSPFAARFPAELFIAPAPDIHSESFLASDDDLIRALASVLQRTLLRIIHKYDDPPYNIVLHTAPFFRRRKNDHGETIKEDYHWHFHIIPRIAKIAGFEIGNDCNINTVLPEEAARLLREAAI